MVLKNKKKTTIEAVWDKVEELINKGKEEISVVELHNRKWNKDCEDLKQIIRQVKKMEVPPKPPILTPKSKSLPILGKLTTRVS